MFLSYLAGDRLCALLISCTYPICCLDRELCEPDFSYLERGYRQL
ncbi:MAG: hypothetical protein N2235_23005 [Fischerella sp.]|nr:hypothetical protein [Fischerella sp.]